jgi:hypothetical protein
MTVYRLRHQRWRLIDVDGVTHYWMPFEHCVCVWDQNGTNKEPKQFARHTDEPVALRTVSAFIRRVYHQKPPPTDQRITLLARTHYYALRDGKVSSYGDAILGSFLHPEQAQAEADRLNPPYAGVLKKMLQMPGYALPTDEPLPPEAEQWRTSMLQKGWLLYRADIVDLYEKI